MRAPLIIVEPPISIKYGGDPGEEYPEEGIMPLELIFLLPGGEKIQLSMHIPYLSYEVHSSYRQWAGVYTHPEKKCGQVDIGRLLLLLVDRETRKYYGSFFPLMSRDPNPEVSTYVEVHIMTEGESRYECVKNHGVNEYGQKEFMSYLLW